MSIYTEGEFSLRRLLPNEWKIYREIRLEALQEEPAVFGANYDEQFKKADEEWQNRLLDPDAAMFILVNRDEVIGMTGIYVPKDTPDQAKLIASYIRKPYRGRGLSALLYRARLDWARGRGLKSVIVAHRASNLASKGANQKFGFIYTHTDTNQWPDGIESDQHWYKLDL